MKTKSPAAPKMFLVERAARDVLEREEFGDWVPLWPEPSADKARADTYASNVASVFGVETRVRPV